ncbi:hypothetical protein ACWGLE_25670 [Streptomyces sp. NPDC055897]
MVLVAVLLPHLLLVAVLALGRYEELMLGGGEAASEPPKRHLVAVPDLPAAEPTPEREEATGYGRRTARGRHAA